jgi:hypothetical protein
VWPLASPRIAQGKPLILHHRGLDWPPVPHISRFGASWVKNVAFLATHWCIRAWDNVSESHHLLRLKSCELLAAILISHMPVCGQYSVGAKKSSSPVLRGDGR